MISIISHNSSLRSSHIWFSYVHIFVTSLTDLFPHAWRLPWVPQVFSRVRRGASSAAGRHIFGLRLACVAGVWKGRERGFLGARETQGVCEEGGRETPARKPLFSPSRLLIMCAKITQLWMTSCQISLAAMRLFKSYFAYCFSFVFLKQEIWSEGPI